MTQTTLKDEAINYKAPQKLNIADLDVVRADLPITIIKGTDSKGVAYEYKAYVEGNKEYYVSNSVIAQIQKILKLKPTVTLFKVKKTGTGMATKYDVEPLD